MAVLDFFRNHRRPRRAFRRWTGTRGRVGPKISSLSPRNLRERRPRAKTSRGPQSPASPWRAAARVLESRRAVLPQLRFAGWWREDNSSTASRAILDRLAAEGGRSMRARSRRPPCRSGSGRGRRRGVASRWLSQDRQPEQRLHQFQIADPLPRPESCRRCARRKAGAQGGRARFLGLLEVVQHGAGRRRRQAAVGEPAAVESLQLVMLLQALFGVIECRKPGPSTSVRKQGPGASGVSAEPALLRDRVASSVADTSVASISVARNSPVETST